MPDLGATFLVGMTLLITVPTALAIWLLLPRIPQRPQFFVTRRRSSPTPRTVERVATSRTPRPMERVSVNRSIR
jgi:hypothetical protein